MIVAVSRACIRLVVLLLLLAVAAPAALAAAKYPRYLLWIAPELRPMTWLQTVVLVLAAAAAGLISFTGSLRGWSGWQRLPYAALGLGLLYLALDDRFAVHERIRDRILAPRNLRIPGLTWLASGHFQMRPMAVAGLLLLPFVLRALRRDRLAFLLFILGAVTAAVAPSALTPSTEHDAGGDRAPGTDRRGGASSCSPGASSSSLLSGPAARPDRRAGRGQPLDQAGRPRPPNGPGSRRARRAGRLGRPRWPCRSGRARATAGAGAAQRRHGTGN